MFGRGKKYKLPSQLVSTVMEFQEYKDPVTQTHVRLKDGREYVVRIWYPDRIWAIKGYTYLPFSGNDIEDVYQTEQDSVGEPHNEDFMLLDDWVILQMFSIRRWQMKFRETTNWLQGKNSERFDH